MEEMKKSIDTNGEYLWEEQGGGEYGFFEMFCCNPNIKRKNNINFCFHLQQRSKIIAKC